MENYGSEVKQGNDKKVTMQNDKNVLKKCKLFNFLFTDGLSVGKRYVVIYFLPETRKTIKL